MTTSFIVAGGMGAFLNCALFSPLTTPSVDHLLQEMFIQPLSAMSKLLPVILGFLCGTLVLLVWNFLKTRVIRFLLEYDGWFLHPRRPINKLWMVLMILLMGRKNRGSMNYQDLLPSLPVPSLKGTCKKYLNSVRALLTPEEYKKTEEAVKEFEKKDGKTLQWWLKLRSWQKRNWLEEWWIDFIYLRQRTPTPFNSNYYACGNREVTTKHGIDRAAEHIHHSAKFALGVRNGTIQNAMATKVAPFCMNAQRYAHMAARIPQEEMDKIVMYDHKKPRHFVVLRQGKFYMLEVVSKTGRVLPSKAIKQHLQKIAEMAGDERDETGVAAFTALPRAKWAAIRARLEQRPANKETLTTIDSSFSTISLDTENVDQHDLEASAQHLFHGNGYNRWFDKCHQLICTDNGVPGANVEHSSLDATIMCQLWEYVLANETFDSEGHVLEPKPGTTFDTPAPYQLTWDLDGFEAELAEAKTNVAEMIVDSDLAVVSPGYGKSFPKSVKLSPDGWYQYAMQLAYYRMHKEFVLTYESATTRLYYRGRTETIRPVCDASVAFCKAMDDPSVSKEETRKLLKEAVDYQCKYKFESMRGMGVDRHLFGLYVVAKGLKIDPLPKIFTDKAFNFSFKLSTSQSPVKLTDLWSLERSAMAGGFGAVTDDGYGVSYIVVGEDDVNFSIHSKRSCPKTDSRKFGAAIKQAMWDMRALYE